MYLKSLTMKGFKSFASSTTLRLEPGITAVVGPNGSGKSNVVDAIAWVLGEQGAKALRGGKMEDVIFAGTADRPPLGRAEVTLTIDNSDGALPIDYTEVSITRRMFRDGAGEYELNGKACRLLDIQELLSDSGIGREMHVIVGQGQLDAVLSARPEDRRAFIEEAAGVLKHRKRKERAQRRLDSSQANFTRLSDLLTEIRRQLGPLGRQAAVARRAAGIQADLRDSRMRLLADDIAQLTAQIAKDAVDEQALDEQRDRITAALTEATATRETAEAALKEVAPALQRAQDTWFALSALAERFRGTVSLAAERSRHLSAPLPNAGSGREPEELEAAAERAEMDEEAAEAAREGAQETVDAVAAERGELESMLRTAEQELLSASRAIADRREGLARLAGQVQAARSRLSAADDAAARLAGAIAEAAGRATTAEQEFAGLQGSVGDLDSSEIGLDADHEDAVAALEAAQARVSTLTEELRAARAQDAELGARIDALRLGLDPKDGRGAVLGATDRLTGVVGPVSGQLKVAAGAERAVAAALGPLADAIVVTTVADAAAALRLLRESDGGRAGLMVEQAPGSGEASDRPDLPAGARWALDLVTAPERLRTGVVAALAGVAVVDDLDAAQALVAAQSAVRAVTADGDLIGAGWAAGGTDSAQSTLERQLAVDRAEEQRTHVRATVAAAEAALAGATAEVGQRQSEATATLAALHDSDARMSAVEEQLNRLAGAARSAKAELSRLEQQRAAADAARTENRQAVADLEARLHAAQADSEDESEEPDASRRDELADRTAVVRQREVEARLTLRSAEERVRAVAGKAEGLRRTAAMERARRARAAAESAERERRLAVARRVVTDGERILARLEQSLAQAEQRREQATARQAQAQQAAATARGQVAELQADLDRLTGAVHAGEVVRAQQAVRAQQLAEQALADFAVSAEDLVASHGPDVLVPPTAEEVAEYESARERGEQVSAPPAMRFDRPTQQRRAKRAERDLTTLGKVNPLALEEFAALEERHAFLSTQLEDLKSTRKELLAVIKEVDEKILELFTSAYWDVEREFKTVFATLFPGGDGELVLTNPDDMLLTGIEVNARPPGKKVKRLSLLSGGERSLTAVALLVAIFRARPSPFYVMDEVEAALDEVNLTRLVGLLTELRDSSQLIIITHQKFTMEAADALYGVSMRGDGITAVISQRIRERPPAGAASDPATAPDETAAAVASSA
ncbi:chromosome segregation protein SMC [Nakamurella flava]|uniref:Chromosome partition protein Smc n=1 Tax=Nakamurella flava TaxID=2576308 RepID=A0A4U6QL04_9ACTN|nr:chromosome segregation protein SMC [Nakamurella flava]TKV61163.1 chromosome segregation protein SMC [Nakamurella flava]